MDRASAARSGAQIGVDPTIPDSSGTAGIGPRANSARREPQAIADEDLMLAYAGGDSAAFERLYDRHEAPVYRFLLRSVGNRAAAEELLQEVWLAVVRNAGRYRPQALFRTWLYRIARTRLIDHWRARDPAILLSLDAPAASNADGCDVLLGDTIAADESQQPLAQALARAQALALVGAVEALPPAQREVFLLHAQGDLTLAQIAEVTGAGFETAKSRLRYALDKLRAVRQEWT
jgi:RNA polymerase sigma factor (sigma-70 family)